LGIPTHHWVRFEMTGFKDVVNAVGGVNLYLDCPFYEPIFNLDTNSWEYFTLPAGENHMDGETAYWYVRLRLRESDIGRAQRQRQFLWALRERALNANLLIRFPELWSAFRNSYSTDLSFLDMLDLVRFGLALNPENVRASGISLKELQSYITERGASVLVITDPARVLGVVDGIWNAPAMADAYRHDSNKCQPIPDGAPVMKAESPLPTPAPTAEPSADQGAAAANETPPAGGG
jgi:polyisoprenyl-teichoic acid--peptidoglycan teichoic acid transferase